MAPSPLQLAETGSKLLDRLRNYYHKGTVELPPPISERTAFFCAGLYTLFYVAPFYISPTLRANATTSRDAPSVIQARVRAVGLTCVACTVVTVYALTVLGSVTPEETLRLVGVWPVNFLDVFQALGLVMILFTCSFYEMIIVDGEWRDWSLSAFKEGIWDSWTGYRNLLIAPITEEIVFRALTIPLFLLARSSPIRIVFLTPLVFGLAHLHHLFAFLQARTPPGQRFPPASIWVRGIFISTFQFAYTSLFGFFAAFIFLRTGNIWAVIVAHSFCNKMGVPRLWGRLGQYNDAYVSQKPTTPDVAQGKRDDDSIAPGSSGSSGDGLVEDEEDESQVSPAIPQNLGISWTVCYYVLVLLGAYAFGQLLFPLTASNNALVLF